MEELIRGNGYVILCVFAHVCFCIHVYHLEDINCTLKTEEIPSTAELNALTKKGMTSSNVWELKQDKLKLEIRHTFLIGSIIVS